MSPTLLPMTLTTSQPWLNSYAAVEAEIRQLLQTNDALSHEVRQLEGEMAVARREQQELALRLFQLQEEQQAAQLQVALLPERPPEARTEAPTCGAPALATFEGPPVPTTTPTPGTQEPPQTPEPQAQTEVSPAAQPAVAQQPTGDAAAGEEHPPAQLLPADAGGPPELSDGAIKNKLVQVGTYCAYINHRPSCSTRVGNTASLCMPPRLTSAPRHWQRRT